MLFIHLKIAFQSASEFVCVCLSFGDCGWRHVFSNALGLCSLSFKFQKEDLEPRLLLWGAAASFSLAVLLPLRAGRGPRCTLFSPNTLENLVRRFPKHHLNL